MASGKRTEGRMSFISNTVQYLPPDGHAPGCIFKKDADEQNMEAGITFSWVPGSYLPSEHTWEKYNSESQKSSWIKLRLLARKKR